MKIIKTLDGIRDFEYEEYYSLEENVCLRFYCNSLHVKDLQNALKKGKEVDIYIVKDENLSVNDNFSIELMQYLSQNNISMVQFIKKLLDGSLEIQETNIIIKKRKEKGVRIFNPFYIPKKIKEPTKWKTNTIVKGILSGQIFKGECTMYLTDDYARDYENNYGKGSICLLELCKELVESPSGWWINQEKMTDEFKAIGVNCYSYNYNTVYFDPNRQRKIEVEEIETANNVIDLFQYKMNRVV